MSEPVSPADTIRRVEELREKAARHGRVVSAGDETYSESPGWNDVLFLLAVGERDKAEASAHTSLRVELANIFGPVKPREGQTWNEAMLIRIGETLVAEGEKAEGRDRRQIARLTAALEAAAWLAEFFTAKQRETYECGHGATVTDVCLVNCAAHARMVTVAAVLADEEDARRP